MVKVLGFSLMVAVLGVGLGAAGTYSVARSLPVPQPTALTQSDDMATKLAGTACKCGKNLQSAELRLIDTSTQGNDKIDFYRMDTTDDNGPITIWVVFENGRLDGGLYAQNEPSRP